MTTRSKNALFPAASPEADPASPVVKRAAIDAALALVLVLAYAIAEIALFANHVPWRDEAQGWLVAMALSGPLDFLIIPGGEGHPPLWFWILRGLGSVLNFDQARYLTLGVAILNGLLFWRLLNRQPLLLAVALCSSVILMQWGYSFRPYSLVLTTILLALLLDRAGHRAAGTWLLAFGCGFHFFAGFPFALWLLVQWQRGTRVSRLTGPSILALFFAASAIISGMGNPASGINVGNVLPGTLNGLSWWMPGMEYRHPVAGIGYLVLLAFGLWRSPFILAVLLALTLLFAAATALIYGEFLWHAAFMMLMAFMAFVMAGERARIWVLAVLMAPQALLGIANAKIALTTHMNGDIDIYNIVQADAGMDTIPQQQLVGWPDYMVQSAATQLDFTYRSGNNGMIMGPVDWRTRERWMIDPGLASLPTPYWLVCKDCATLIDFISSAGLKPTNIGTALNYSDGRIYAYRIDR
ncbi:hypothetical protein [Devosia sp. SL43]|uniref:hypothetical protein n=1 Tax=Devosia sp. SL43 TaxID=2806348 RepID=UPI001F3562AE|nr:hypothetical protein [Devosia sp. SL43]UJW86566.1 hypothetical protein IM737_04690 [Devosia sp. SL43]